MKQTRRFLALLLALCLSWTQISPALAVALEDEQTEPVAVVEETVAPEVVETEAAAEETEAPEVIETEAVEEEVVADEAVNEGEPVGTWENPEPLTMGKHTVTFTPDSDNEYYFSWEAPVEGLLAFDLDIDLPEWDFYCRYDNGPGGFSLGSDYNADATYAAARPAAGDKLEIWVRAGTTEDGKTVSGTFTFTVSFNDKIGSKEVPVRLDANNAEWNEDKSVGTMIVTAPVGTTWYDVYSLGDKIIKVDGIAPPEQDNGRYTTGIFPITNNTDAEKDYVVTFCDAVKGDLPSMAIIMEIWDFTWNADRTVSQGKITLPVGTTWYVTRGNEMNVYVDGVLVYEPTFVQPGPAFSLTNDTGAEKEVSVKCTYPVGIQGNYDKLTLGSHTAEIKDGQYMGYGYRTVVAETTEFTFSIDTSAPEWAYEIYTHGADNRLISIFHSSRQSTIVDTVNFTVGKGNSLVVTVGTKLNQGTASAGTISFELKEAPKPGSSAEYPIELDTTKLVWDENNISARTTVTAPVGTTWYSVAITDMVVNVNGMPVSGKLYGTEPQVFSITNDTGAEKEYEIILAYVVGNPSNPELLTMGEHTARIAPGNWMGHTYYMIAPSDGELTITIDPSAPVWKYSVHGYELEGFTHSSADETIVTSDTVSVTAGSRVHVSFTTRMGEEMDTPYAAINFTASFVSTVPGATQENPIQINEWTWNENNTAATTTVTAPAGTTWYASYGIGGMGLSINGAEPIQLPGGNPRMPVVFSIENTTGAEAEFNLSVSYLPGHQMNPVVLTELTGGEASLAAGGAGYYYTYTAAETGTYTFYITSITEGVTGDIIIYNTTSGSMKTLLEDGVDNYGLEVTMDVTEGDELQIMLNVMPDMNWNYPAADISWFANFTYPVGSEMNPIMPEFQWNDEQTEATATVTVPAGTTQYFAAYANGMMLSINGGEAFKLVAQGVGRVPAIFTITNDSEEDAEYALVLTYAVGTRENPAELQLADEYSPEIVNVATLEEGNWDGYVFGWTAPEKGELTITMHKGKAGWNYSIMNMTTYASTDMHASADESPVISETIAVNAGDEIMVMVNTCGADLYDVTPAGSVYFTAEYTMAVGIETNPIMVQDPTMPTTGTIEAGQTLYFSGYGLMGMTMTVENAAALTLNVEGTEYTADENGIITLVIPSNPMAGRMPVNFSLTAAETAEYSFSFQYPIGTDANPAEMVIGTNSAEFAVNAQEYIFTWTAEDRGELTITMNEGTVGWQYCINNMSSYSYGDYHRSDEDPTVAETVSVNKGDEIIVKVISYDPMNPWAAPAGTVSFDVAFTVAEGTESKPIMIYDASQPLDGEIPAYTTVYFSAYGIGGMYIDLYSDGALQLEVNGEIFTENEYGWINTQMPAGPMGPRFPVTFAVTNVTEEPAFYSMGFYHRYGSMGNPAQLTIGKNTAYVMENDQEFYSMIATKSGYLTVTMTGKEWTYTLNNLTAGIYGDNLSSTDETVVKSQTIKVNAGDEIQLVVTMPFSYETYTSPSGIVKFTTAFAATQYELLAGKAMTLKFTDPETGKAIAASKATWEITSGAEFATLKGAKLTANKDITEASEVVVTATSGETVNTFVVTIYPAATEVKIYTSTYDKVECVDVVEDVTGKTVNIYTNCFSFDWSMPSIFAEVGPEGAMNQVTWKSSNNKIAFIDQEGYLNMMWSEKNQGPATGTVTFTATAADGSGKKATVKVNISTLVEWMDITDNKGNFVTELGTGKSVQLAANTNPNATNKKVTWEIVEGADFAKITSSGKLTANKGLTTAQYVTVKATAQDAGKAEAYLNITISPVANKVVITGAPETGKFDMNSWESLILAAEVYAAGDAEGIPTASQSVTWKSSNEKIATIDEGGYVWCNKPGTVTFTATANDGSNKKATVKITITKSISYIELPVQEIVAGGKSLTLKPEIYDADATNKKLDWTMTDADGFEVDKSVATLKNGKLTTKKVAEPTAVYVTCTATDGSYASATCAVLIFPATNKVTIMRDDKAVKGTLTMAANEELNFFYVESDPTNCFGEYTWKSSNEKIATIEINSDGSINVIATGEKTGTVTITATAMDGTNKKASFKVKVTPAE